jgi:hypothetical protein
MSSTRETAVTLQALALGATCDRTRCHDEYGYEQELGSGTWFLDRCLLDTTRERQARHD